MKLQLIKELGSDQNTIWFNVWKTDDDGKKISCVECCQSLPEAEKALDKAIEDHEKTLLSHIPEILKEVTLP